MCVQQVSKLNGGGEVINGDACTCSEYTLAIEASQYFRCLAMSLMTYVDEGSDEQILTQRVNDPNPNLVSTFV